MTADLKSGNLDAAWGIPAAQFRTLESEPGIEARRLQLLQLGLPQLQLLRRAELAGQPGAQGLALPPRAQLRDRPAEARATSPTSGNAAPGTTILPPEHVERPRLPLAAAGRPGDAASTWPKAGQLLDEAGYPLKDGDGVRPGQGKPIKLRLWATTDNAPAQTEAQAHRRLAASSSGSKIEFSVLDAGALSDRIWNFEGDTYAPRLRHVHLGLGGLRRPRPDADRFTTAQIGSTNEPCWSNAEYDKLADEQATRSSTRSSARQLIWRMQQIMYEQTPWVVLTYPEYLEAYNTASWTAGRA